MYKKPSKSSMHFNRCAIILTYTVLSYIVKQILRILTNRKYGLKKKEEEEVLHCMERK